MKQLIISTIILMHSLWANASQIETTSAKINPKLTTELGTLGENEVTIIPSESLTLVNTKRQKKVNIVKGMSLEITTKDKQLITGEFSQYSEDSIELIQNISSNVIALNDIERIIVYHKNGQNVASKLLKLTVGTSSIAALSLGSGALVGGIIALEKSVLLGVGLISVSVPLIYFGVQLYILAKKRRTKINFSKGWEVSVDR